jgi:acyl dehydratase
MTGTAALALAVGQEAEPRTFPPLTRTDLVKYQGASGDFHPLHHDEPFAQATGFPTVFSVGMLQAGMLASYVTDWLGAQEIRQFKVRFVEQVWPGDELTCTARITDIADIASAIPDAPGGRQVSVALACTRQTGAVALSGSARFILP